MTKTVHLFAGYSVFATNNPRRYDKYLKSFDKNVKPDFLVKGHTKRLKGRACEFDNPEKGYYMLAVYISKHATPKTAIHEAVHTVDYLMDQINVHNDEFQADLTGYLGAQLIPLTNNK